MLFSFAWDQNFSRPCKQQEIYNSVYNKLFEFLCDIS
jgi:hypothetical protein